MKSSRYLGVVDFLRREPLVHFLAIAALIFVVNSAVSGDRREVITVSQGTIDYLVRQEEDLRLRPLDESEREGVLRQFIDDEILVREARKRGFDDSSRIRTLLVQNMRFFFKQDLATPSEEDLHAYFQANIERFTRPPTVDMEQLYFENPDAVPGDMLARLGSGADYRRFGDASISFGRVVRNVKPRDIATTFGRAEAEAIVAIEDDLWHGPFQSSYGTHFLRVTARHPEQVPSYETGSKWLEMEWMVEQQNARMDAALTELRADYRVDLTAADSDE